jgi:hypothetical protein
MPVCSFQGRNRGRKKNVKDGLLKVNVLNLNPSEVRLIQTIRELKFGTVTANLQDGKIIWIKREENIKIE